MIPFRPILAPPTNGRPPRARTLGRRIPLRLLRLLRTTWWTCCPSSTRAPTPAAAVEWEAVRLRWRDGCCSLLFSGDGAARKHRILSVDSDAARAYGRPPFARHVGAKPTLFRRLTDMATKIGI